MVPMGDGDRSRLSRADRRANISFQGDENYICFAMKHVSDTIRQCEASTRIADALAIGCLAATFRYPCWCRRRVGIRRHARRVGFEAPSRAAFQHEHASSTMPKYRRRSFVPTGSEKSRASHFVAVAHAL